MNQLQEEIAKITDTVVVRIVGAFTLSMGERPSLQFIDKVRAAVYDAAGLFALAGVAAAGRERARSRETLPPELLLVDPAEDDEDSRPTRPNLPRIAPLKKGRPPPPPPRK
jgi:hypothetical protein